MTPQRWQRVRELVESVLELPPRERPAYLDGACTADRSLRAEVDTLLRAHADAGTSWDRPVFDLRRQVQENQPEADEPLPEAIGPYRVLKPLGYGGMGRVYLAERTGSYRQRVAVKVLKPGLDSRELVRRFRSERQILAQLEHPYIAKILDGGSSEGRPFIVMELVDGLPIDRYCDEHRLGVTARLELMRKVCDAVRFAHRNLVVHRDLKPANILITAAGDPKLLDFGIAKLLRPETFPHTVLPTTPGLIPMTPDYASPEQVRGEPITTASDVYALGVLLYELLTGHSPYLLAHHEPAAVARAVCEQQPRRPSSVVIRRHGASHSGGEAQRLRLYLRGDLDTIVLMALRKEPRRRYASVEQLADDLDRHLTGRPVHARPDTVGYRTRKFLSRHSWGVSLAAATLAVPVAFTGVLLVQRKKILRQRNHAQEVARLLVHLFEMSDLNRTRP